MYPAVNMGYSWKTIEKIILVWGTVKTKVELVWSVWDSQKNSDGNIQEERSTVG